MHVILFCFFTKCIFQRNMRNNEKINNHVLNKCFGHNLFYKNIYNLLNLNPKSKTLIIFVIVFVLN